MIRSCGVMSSFEGLGRRLAIAMSLIGRSELLFIRIPEYKAILAPFAAVPEPVGPPI